MNMGPRELGQATGVSTDTLRHYERLGLLPGVVRTRAGYRRYPPATVDRVLLIQRSLIVGFSLKDLVRVFGERDRGGAPCRSVRALVGERLNSLAERIEQLHALRDELTTMVRDWDKRLARTPAGKPAHLLMAMGSRPAIERLRQARPKRARKVL